MFSLKELFSGENTVEIKSSELLALFRESVKSEFILNAVRAKVPHEYIIAMAESSAALYNVGEATVTGSPDLNAEVSTATVESDTSDDNEEDTEEEDTTEGIEDDVEDDGDDEDADDEDADEDDDSDDEDDAEEEPEEEPVQFGKGSTAVKFPVKKQNAPQGKKK